MDRCLCIFLFLLAPVFVGAQGKTAPISVGALSIVQQQGYTDTIFHDHIDRTADDFVIVSLLISEPSKGLFSCMGHTAFRMQCPSFGLDYVFHYVTVDMDETLNETETYLLGRFVVQMVADSFDTYVANGKNIRRGVTEYPLYLPAVDKQFLWKLLDKEMMKGGYMKYDFFREGCAIKMAQLLTRAVAPKSIDYSLCDTRLRRPKFETLYRALADYPWCRFGMMTALYGHNPQEKYDDFLFLPSDLAKAWQSATIDGENIAGCGQAITRHWYYEDNVWLTPMRVALLLLLLGIINLFVKRPYINWLLLATQVFMSIIIFCITILKLSDISWNWLFVPFNILPVLFWHWRHYWALPYAIVLAIWVLAMLFVPSCLVDSTHVVLTIAFILVLCNNRGNTYQNVLSKVLLKK